MRKMRAAAQTLPTVNARAPNAETARTGTDGSDLPASITVKTSGGDVTVDGYSNGGGNAIVMYDVYSGQTTLLDADGTIVDDNLLNLSHVCVGPDGRSVPVPGPLRHALEPR